MLGASESRRLCVRNRSGIIPPPTISQIAHIFSGWCGDAPATIGSNSPFWERSAIVFAVRFTNSPPYHTPAVIAAVLPNSHQAAFILASSPNIVLKIAFVPFHIVPTTNPALTTL